MLSSMDDYPVHQVAEFIRNVGVSDRNFYDRYYFNLHGSSDELFMVMGMGQYPNLATQDAFAVVRRKNAHHVVRASRELGDRMDTSVGSFRIEVIEGLKKLRFILEDKKENPIAMDVTWEGSIPAFAEPRQFIRRHGRVLFDTQRLAQTGRWQGTLRVGDETFEVTPDRWGGSRDRSWGVRPVGEAEPQGVQATSGASMQGMWMYCPVEFDDYSILCIINEHDDGVRELEEAVRIWKDPQREPEFLGRPEHAHRFNDEKTFIVEGQIIFPDAPGGAIEISIEPLTHVYVMVGTGYGLESDWRHGMYQGKFVEQRFTLDMEEDKERMFGLIDNAARFSVTSGDRSGDVGYGLFEYFFMGKFARYQLD